MNLHWLRAAAILLFVTTPAFAAPVEKALWDRCQTRQDDFYKVCNPSGRGYDCLYERGVFFRICIQRPSAQDRSYWDSVLKRYPKEECEKLEGQWLNGGCRLKGVRPDQRSLDLLYEPPPQDGKPNPAKQTNPGKSAAQLKCENNEGRWDKGRCFYFCDDNPGAEIPNTGGYRCGME